MTYVHPQIFHNFLRSACLGGIENKKYLEQVFILYGQVEGNTAYSTPYLLSQLLEILSISRQGSDDLCVIK